MWYIWDRSPAVNSYLEYGLDEANGASLSYLVVRYGWRLYNILNTYQQISIP